MDVRIYDPPEVGAPTFRNVGRVTDCTRQELVERWTEPGYFTLGMHAYIYDSRGRFLLQKRAQGKGFRPGQWEVHMGHALAGESSFDCALRELREELGVSLPPDSFVKVYRWVEAGARMLTDLYFVRADLDESSLTLQKDEVIGVQWVSKTEMLDFVRDMDYRPESYKNVVAQYIQDCIEEAPAEEEGPAHD